MSQTRPPNEPLQATAAAPFVFDGLRDLPLHGLVVGQPTGAVPELRPSAE